MHAKKNAKLTNHKRRWQIFQFLNFQPPLPQSAVFLHLSFKIFWPSFAPSVPPHPYYQRISWTAPNCSGRLEFQLEAPSLIKTFVISSSSFWVVQKRLGATHILKVKPQIEDALLMNTRHHAHVRPITAKQRVCCRTYSFGGTLAENSMNSLAIKIFLVS